MPLNNRYDLTYFESANADLNDFLKNDALADQEWMVSKTYLCCWKKSITGYMTLVTDTLEVKVVDEKPVSVGFYEKHGFKLIEKYKNNDFPKMYLNMYPIIERMQPKESLVA